MINSYVPVKYPSCSSFKYKRYEYSKSGVQRYLCVCEKTFLPGTIFDEHRISISEWMEYSLNLLSHVSITTDSWNNKNPVTTSKELS